MSDVLLCAQEITKRFLGTVALKNVSLKLHENEILAVMGENGAGKSTLMKVLSGAYPCSEYEGTITVAGENCRFSNPTDSENSGICMIYQELNLELDLTVTENILLGRLPTTRMGMIDWETARTRAREALARLHSDIDINITVRNLSPSMQQLVSIARALVRKPKILILDEPTSVLTESETQNLMKVLRELKASGLSCIYISHKLDEVFAISDRMVILRDGHYISEYLQVEGYDATRVIEDMIGRRINVMYPSMEREIGGEVLRLEHFQVPHPSAFGKNIIEDAGFTLHQGEILGLAGLVGAGRSELIGALFGMNPKTRGDVYLNGGKVNINTPEDAKALGIGMLTEDRKKNGFIGCMTIQGNMTLTILREISGHLLINSKRERARAGEYFEKLHVKAPSLDTPITSLSGGNQQKVILAKWLITNLKVLLLDEPTRGIDVGTKSEIYKLMLELSARGISMVMISSELPELIAMCDRFVVLGKGRVQKVLEKAEASEVSILRAASNT